MTSTTTRTAAADIDTAYFRSVEPFDGQPDPDRGGGDQAATKIWVDPCSIGGGLDVTLTIDRTNIRLDMSAKEARDLATLLIAALPLSDPRPPFDSCQEEHPGQTHDEWNASFDSGKE